MNDLKNLKKYSNIIILALIIVVLGLYLVLRTTNKVNYTLPKLSEVNTEEIAEIHVEGTEEAYTIQREGENWYLGEEGYPASNGMVNRLATKAAKLTLTDLVSAVEQYNRYKLDDKQKVTVTLLDNEGNVLRKVSVGSKSKTYKHTFITIRGDERVFLALGDLRYEFDKTIKELRDKSVFAFTWDSATQLKAVHRDGSEVVLTQTSAKSEGESDKSTDTVKTKEESEEETTAKLVWKDQEGEIWEEDTIRDTLQTLASLAVMNYRQEEIELGTPLLKVTVSGLGFEEDLTLWEGRTGGYPGVSSENDYPFWLSTYQGEKMTETFFPPPEEEEGETASGESNQE